MATIIRRPRKDGKPSYLVLVRRKSVPGHPGTYTRRKTFRAHAEAKAWATKVERELDERKNPAAMAEKVTLSDAVKEYRAFMESEGKSIDRSTNDRIEWWVEQLGQESILDITPPVIVATRKKLDVAPSTQNRYKAAISAVFQHLVKEEHLLSANPVHQVSTRSEPRGRDRVLTDEERKALLKACKDSSDPRLYPLVWTALSTAARRGELMSLQWSQVDLNPETASITLLNTKNGDSRKVGISVETARLLKSMRPQVPPVNLAERYVFESSTTGAIEFPRKRWMAALKAAKIKDFHFHDIRHDAATRLAKSGATLTELMAVLGHRSPAMVSRYSHLTGDHTRRIILHMNEQTLENSTGD